ncbi:MAG TPA: response regulator [Acidocella sp.]|nr:response regulator [Acidocella sp.]
MAAIRPVVLVYSDDEPIGHALRFVLRMEGVDVQLCPDAGALLASPALAQAHCLVLKDNLPVLDGCALLRAAREKGADAPAILLVSRQTLAVTARAAEAGMWIVLERPILDNRLVDAIMSCLPGRDAALIRTNT